jgi:tetratricopeptide (TPR) repeat protein
MNTSLSKFVPNSSKILVFFEVAKSGALAAIAFACSIMGALGVFTSLTTSEVIFEPLKVPAPFTELGYTSEITTTRILDEVARINAQSTSTKDTKNFGNKMPGEELSKLTSLPLPGLGGIDLKAIQDLIQGLLGVKKERISGEITFTKNKDAVIYNVRIRQLPENKMLVNFSTDADVPDVIKQTSLKIIEKMDPAVAASYYRWSKDTINALRMVDEALRNDEDYDDNYALVGRAQIYIQMKKFDLAQSDIDRIFKNNREFVPAITTQAFLFNEKGEFAKALEFSEKAKKYWPNNWRPYNNAGDALDGLGRGDEAEAAYIQTIKYNPSWWTSYDEISAFHLKRKRADLAEEVLLKGLTKFPENTKLLTSYGEYLLHANKKEQAFNYLSKAHKVEPTNVKVWELLIRLDEYKNDPLIIEVHKLVREKIRDNPSAPIAKKLHALLKESEK